MASKLGSKVFIWYTNLLWKTCKIEYVMENADAMEDSIIVFWHGEGLCAYFLLKLFSEARVGVVMTADPRGDVIEDMTNYYGGIPLKLPNGAQARHGIHEIVQRGKQDKKLVISFSVDGPLGPYHQPSKMVFSIGNKTEKKVLCCRIDVKRKLRLTKRWDKYTIPLPFGSIRFRILGLPVTTKQELQDFEPYQQKIKELLES